MLELVADVVAILVSEMRTELEASMPRSVTLLVLMDDDPVRVTRYVVV